MNDWRDFAACLTEDAELFHPVGKTGPAAEQIAKAKAVCHGCGVAQHCLDDAMRTGHEGIWGGTTKDERDALKRRGRRAELRANRPPQKRELVNASQARAALESVTSRYGVSLNEIARRIQAAGGTTDPTTLQLVASGRRKHVARSTHEAILGVCAPTHTRVPLDWEVPA